MNGHVLDQLYEVIAARRGGDTSTSWTANLLANAPKLPCDKLKEETAEVIVEALKGDAGGLTKEAADLIYHLLVVMAAVGVTPADVWAELDRRCGQSGIAEKASRTPS